MELRSISAFKEYMGQLKAYRDGYIICVAVKDTIFDIDEESANLLIDFGMENLHRKGQRGYIFLMNDGVVHFSEFSEKDKSVEKSIVLKDIKIHLQSKTWRGGNKASISVGGYDFAVNKRGLNIVVVDIKNERLMDSVCFDFFPEHNSGCSRLGISLDVPLYMKKKIELSDSKLTLQYDSAEYRQKEIVKRLHDRSVVLVGGGEVAKKFYEEHCNHLNIRCVLTDMKNERDITLADKRKISVRPYRKEEIRETDLLIICRPSYTAGFQQIKKMLDNEGFLYGKNYMSHSFVSAVLSEKKILTIIGYCQLMVFYYILKKIPSVTKNYSVHYFRQSESEFLYPECIEFAKITDILIYVSHFAASIQARIPFENIAPPDAVRFRYPNTSFRGLHPYKYNDLRTKTRLPISPQRPFQYVEPIYEELVEEGKSNREIYDIVRREDLISSENIEKNFRMSIKSIEINERKSDLIITDFILENYQHRLLYRDCLHYENILYYEIARRIVESLNLCKREDVDALEKNKELQWMGITEVPILPCVAKVLRVEFATEDYLYSVRNGDDKSNIKMNFREWVECYCDYARAINAFEKLGIFDRFKEKMKK